MVATTSADPIRVLSPARSSTVFPKPRRRNVRPPPAGITTGGGGGPIRRSEGKSRWSWCMWEISTPSSSRATSGAGSAP